MATSVSHEAKTHRRLTPCSAAGGNNTRRALCKAAFTLLRSARDPVDFLIRYLFGEGSYPTAIAIRQGSGVVTVYAFTPHDILTINEIFFREDYSVPPRCGVVVDLGSNIGVSVLYFILRGGPGCHVYAYEPVPENIEKPHANLKGHEDAFTLTPCAIGPTGGTADFGLEATGRYGGLGLALDVSIRVTVLDVNAELAARGGPLF